ncbi:hypothetical protein BKA62DRAFT_265069 [Auriculariales sp. MPI-PUGE-AT-0066]|nr:hypothetical protein BKA62DRAFT_265069 [Auriculariales sp. MPI-PUGE-AT-0066]
MFLQGSGVTRDAPPAPSPPAALRRAKTMPLMSPGPDFCWPKLTSPRKAKRQPPAPPSPPRSPIRAAVSKELSEAQSSLGPLKASISAILQTMSISRVQKQLLTSRSRHHRRASALSGASAEVIAPYPPSHEAVSLGQAQFTTPTTSRIQVPVAQSPLAKPAAWNSLPVVTSNTLQTSQRNGALATP